jgi:hypothetical protein
VACASTPYERPNRIGLGASGNAARMPSRIRGEVFAVSATSVKLVV